MPSPWAAAVAVMGMLTLGVMLGSATSQVAQSAGLTSILLEEPAATSVPEEATATAAAEPTAEAEVPTAIPSAVPSVPLIPEASEEPLPQAAPEPTPPPEFFEEEETLPPVKHVFLIVLGENSFEEAFGATATAPYLAQTLAGKGELLSNYYAVTKGELANQIALLSGQGPTAETALDCPNYTDIAPGTLSLTGQVEGSGCVYPKDTPTLPGLLVEKELTWKAYVEDLATPCTRAEGSLDPVVYFRALLDEPKCAEHDVSLEQLAPDLKAAPKTPALSYIVPNDCHDGGEEPCEEGKPVGAQASEEFLQRVVPAIEASPAYKEGGLIAITSALARQTGPTPDVSSCCIAPQYPNLPVEAAAPEATPGPVKPSGGGGRVGLLLISPFVAPGSVNESGYYNHYSLLLSLSELFELQAPGYASEIALTPFDSSVYNSESTAALPPDPQAGSSSSASCRDCASRTPSADQSSPSSSKKPWRAVFDLNAIK
jgi:phosphatidylinositol-3-phosphatase